MSMIRAKTSVYFVDTTGKVHRVVTQSDSDRGVVDIRFSDGRIETVSELYITQTLAAANVIAARRKDEYGRTHKESPKIRRNPV